MIFDFEGEDAFLSDGEDGRSVPFLVGGERTRDGGGYGGGQKGLKWDEGGGGYGPYPEGGSGGKGGLPRTLLMGPLLAWPCVG